MIGRLVEGALTHRILVLGVGVALLIWGVVAFHTLPIEAYPDITDKYVWVITQWPGRAAEEVEQQVTIPIETEVNGVGHLTHLRSISLAGLSFVTILFDDDSDNLQNRQQVLEKLTQVSLPDGLTAQIGPDFSPAGQIYFYSLVSASPQYDLMDLKALQDWVVSKHLLSVPNVASVSIFGGTTREYQVQVDPDKLVAYGLSVAQVEQALRANNVNAGGSFIEKGSQAYNVRVIGLMQTTDDIGATVLKALNGTPIRVHDVAVVTQGAKIRLGRLGKAIRREDGHVVDDDDIVEGIVQMRKGADVDATLAGVHSAVTALNDHVLPAGVKIVPHLDRYDLVDYTTRTVLRNLVEGIVLVLVVLVFMLGHVRSAVIVALTIPFSLLVACIFLDVRHIPANLLSLGALDFGMIVDGSVVMVENILRRLCESVDATGGTRETIRLAAHEVQRPVFYARLAVIAAYIPILSLQNVEGRLFQPMGWTVVFALVGALFFSILLAPVLASVLFRRRVREWRNPLLGWLTTQYPRALRWCVHHRAFTVGVGAVSVAGAILLAFSGRIGSDFLPQLDEGAIWARGTLDPSTGPTEGERVMRQARVMFASFPEVTQVVSQVGRSDDGTDATGFFNTEYFVDLKPRDRWRPEFHGRKDALIAAMNHTVGTIPGISWGFSQPIADNMEEAMSGVKGELAVKIFGPDLKELEQEGQQILAVLRTVPGIEDLGLLRVLGQPNMNLEVDRAKTDQHDINVSEVQDAIETAVGGKPVGQILLAEQRFDLVVRYQDLFRRTVDDIAKIRIMAPAGERVSIGQLCNVKIEDGASAIYRDANSRYLAIRYSVRGRDLGSTVNEAIGRVRAQVHLAPGYSLDWAGEYASQQRANARLAVIIPVTILAMASLIYLAFHTFKWAFLVLVSLVIAPIGGLVALFVTGTHFSVSSGIGFLPLFGVSVQVGLIMIHHINQLRAGGLSIAEAAIAGATRRLRPIVMTMLVATLGLLPAAVSHDIGSDAQRPFAIVIVGGLVTALVMSVFLLPTLYVWIARPDDTLVAQDEAPASPSPASA
jgi:cobalt-zinc-cadmium resistance protein CzcA